MFGRIDQNLALPHNVADKKLAPLKDQRRVGCAISFLFTYACYLGGFVFNPVHFVKGSLVETRCSMPYTHRDTSELQHVAIG